MKKLYGVLGLLLIGTVLGFLLWKSEADEISSASDFQISDETEAVDEMFFEYTSESGDKLLGSTSVVGNRAVVFMNPDEIKVYDAADSVQTEDGLLRKHTIVDGRIVADQAYYKNRDIKTYTLPEGISEVGQFAFSRSSLEEIIMPDTLVNISFGAFYYCDRLGEVDLPSSVMNVEPKAFVKTAWLEEFLESGETFLVSGGVLVAYNGSSKEVVIPDDVRVIAAEAFLGHGEIETISFPGSLKVIGEAAFSECKNLREIYLQPGIEKIKDRAFSGCELLPQVVLPETLKEIGLKAFDRDALYQGQKPVQTFEYSATRPVNDSYRIYNTKKEPDITVTGIHSARAGMDVVDRAYRVELSWSEDSYLMEKAFLRAFGTKLPVNIHIFNVVLTDESEIPFGRLGKNRLSLTIPLPDDLIGRNLKLVGLDRNGQIEIIPVEEDELDGLSSFHLTTGFPSAFGIYSD